MPVNHGLTPRFVLSTRKCYDFEAAATHEVGHVLGFNHPDEAGLPLTSNDCETLPCGTRAADLAVIPGMPYDCMRSFDNVRELEPDEPSSPSVMYSLTQHNPTTCLTTSDLDGLYSLYPDCSLRPEEPVCVTSIHNIGLVRLAIFIIIPVLVGM